MTENRPGAGIRRNTFLNLAGAALPSVLSLAVVPAFLAAIGQARFGVLAIVWVLLSFTEILDFGFGRAAANQVASLHDAPRATVRPVFWTALAFNGVMGVLGAGLLLLLGNLLISSVLKIPEAMRAEALASLPWLALAVPLAITSTALTGTLEGLERFGTVNLISLGANLLMQITPLLAAWAWGPDLGLLVGVTVLSRLIGNLAFMIACLAVLGWGAPVFDRSLVGHLLRFGGWVSVTALLNPILSAMDRFAIGAVKGMEAVTHYAIPYNLATRLGIIPTSLTRTLFPRFAMVAKSDAEALLREATAALLSVMTPLVVVGLVLVKPFLEIWLGRANGQASAAVGAILLVGIWVNSLGSLPYSFLQGRGRPDVTAKFHILELVPYLAALGLGLWFFGIEGAAMAWTLRVAADTSLLFWAVGVPVHRQSLLAAGAGLVTLTGCLALCAFESLPVRVFGGGALIAVTLVWAWKNAPYSVRMLFRQRLPLLGAR